MATVSEVISSAEADFRKAVNKLNDAQQYRAATQVQNLLSNLASSYAAIDDEAKATELD